MKLKFSIKVLNNFFKNTDYSSAIFYIIKCNNNNSTISLKQYNYKLLEFAELTENLNDNKLIYKYEEFSSKKGLGPLWVILGQLRFFYFLSYQCWLKMQL